MQAWTVSSPEKQLTSKKNVVHQAKHSTTLCAMWQWKNMALVFITPFHYMQQIWILNTQASLRSTIWKSSKAAMVSLALEAPKSPVCSQTHHPLPAEGGSISPPMPWGLGHVPALWEVHPSYPHILPGAKLLFLEWGTCSAWLLNAPSSPCKMPSAP